MPHEVRITFKNGSEEWYYNGKLHRSDGPAQISMDGTRIWWTDGIVSRPDGPAVVRPDGSQEWWLNGVLHRTDGPAYVGSDGWMTWWVNGRIHRLDGPAVIKPDGSKEWWLDGVEVTDDLTKMIVIQAWGRPPVPTGQTTSGARFPRARTPGGVTSGTPGQAGPTIRKLHLHRRR